MYEGVDPSQQHSLVGTFSRNAKCLRGQAEHVVTLHLCLNDLDRCQPCRIDSRHQMTHQRRLSRSDIAGDNDKALALRQTIAQIGHRLAVRRAFKIEMRIRSEEHTSELQSLMRISYAVFCLKKQNN